MFIALVVLLENEKKTVFTVCFFLFVFALVFYLLCEPAFCRNSVVCSKLEVGIDTMIFVKAITHLHG